MSVAVYAMPEKAQKQISYRDLLLDLADYVMAIPDIVPAMLESNIADVAGKYLASDEYSCLRKFVRVSVRRSVRRFNERKSAHETLESAVRANLARHLETAGKRAGPSWSIIKNFAE